MLARTVVHTMYGLLFDLGIGKELSARCGLAYMGV
jgi:hypothetical protein